MNSIMYFYEFRILKILKVNAEADPRRLVAARLISSTQSVASAEKPSKRHLVKKTRENGWPFASTFLSLSIFFPFQLVT